MLKGHVFKNQIFGNQIFALFMDTFLNQKCGVLGNYSDKMQVTYNGDTLTVSSGCVCVRGRFLEEDTNTEIAAGTDTAFCKLVIEIDLDRENTPESLAQASYKIVRSANNYPTLTQTDIVANNSGIYQFELAQFKTGVSGITNFVDKRTYLDFNSIYSEIASEYRAILEELRRELENVEDGSAYLLKTRTITIENTDLDDYLEDGLYYFSQNYTPINIPAGVNGWLQVFKCNITNVIKQIWYRHGTVNSNDFEIFVRTKSGSNGWSNWQRLTVENDLYYKSGDSTTLTWTGGGILSSVSTEIQFTIPMPKRMNNVTPTISAGTLSVRVPTGGYLVQDVNIRANNTIMLIKNENLLTVRLVRSSAYSATNNIPLGIQITGLKVDFS